MADNTVLNTGTGGDTIATDDIGGVKHQLVKVEFGAADSVTQVSTANPFPVSDSGGSLTVDNGGTFAVQIAANSSVNVAQVAGTTTDTNSGVKSAGTQRVVLATDQPALTNALKVDGSAVTQPVSGTVTANLGTAAVTNAGTFAVQIAANSSVNNAQVSGTATSVNSGTKDAGTQRVILASDQTVVPVSDNAGSLTVDAPVGTPAFVRLSDGAAAITALPVTDNGGSLTVDGTVTANLAASASATGLSKFHLVSAASTNATNIKASAGKLHGWYIYNSNAAARKVAFHNTAGTPTAGASVTDTIVVPPTSAANAFTDTGIAFSTGIAITTVTELTDAGSTGVAASDLIIGLWFI